MSAAEAAARGDDPELAELVRDFPGWRAWRGVGGIIYVKQVGASPPVVFGGTSVPELRGRITVFLQNV